MMTPKKILAIETSGKICSVALTELAPGIITPDKIVCNPIAEYTLYVGNKHDQFCAELCHRIIKDNELSFEELDAVAVSIGPGSFTGLRVGVSVAKGLCYHLKDSSVEARPKLLAVPTMNALVFNVDLDRKVLAIIPSHNNFVYYQVFNNY